MKSGSVLEWYVFKHFLLCLKKWLSQAEWATLRNMTVHFPRFLLMLCSSMYYLNFLPSTLFPNSPTFQPWQGAFLGKGFDCNSTEAFINRHTNFDINRHTNLDINRHTNFDMNRHINFDANGNSILPRWNLSLKTAGNLASLLKGCPKAKFHIPIVVDSYDTRRKTTSSSYLCSVPLFHNASFIWYILSTYFVHCSERRVDIQLHCLRINVCQWFIHPCILPAHPISCCCPQVLVWIKIAHESTNFIILKQGTGKHEATWHHYKDIRQCS